MKPAELRRLAGDEPGTRFYGKSIVQPLALELLRAQRLLRRWLRKHPGDRGDGDCMCTLCNATAKALGLREGIIMKTRKKKVVAKKARKTRSKRKTAEQLIKRGVKLGKALAIMPYDHAGRAANAQDWSTP